MSSPTDDDWKRMSKLVDIFYNRPDAEPFRDPVAWKEIGTTVDATTRLQTHFFAATHQSYSIDHDRFDGLSRHY
jgi:hypothetical protein